MMNTTQGYLFRDWNVVYIRYCDGASVNLSGTQPLLAERAMSPH